MRHDIIFTLGLTLALAGCQDAPQETTKAEFDTTLIEQGRLIAESECAVCHSTGAIGVSPRTDAPALRTVLSHNNPNALADDFREHIHVGHPDMPDFDFTVMETESLLAYLTSIQVDVKD